MSSCIFELAPLRQLAKCSPETISVRLIQVAPVAYPILVRLLKRCPSAVLTGSVVAAAAGTAESSWHPTQWKKSDLDVFCAGESTETAVRLIQDLLPHAQDCLWSHRGRVVEMTVGETRIQIIHTGGSLPDSHLETPADVLGTFDMSHLQVGLVQGRLVCQDRWRDTLESGVSEIISRDVLQSRVEKNLQRGYRLCFPVSIQARGLQGYDGSHWRVPAPLGVNLVEHLMQVNSYQQQPSPASPTLLSVWGQPDQVQSPVMHGWSVADLQTPVTAWAWLRAQELPRAAARLWWDLVLAICPHPERYRLRGTSTIGNQGLVDQPLADLRIDYLPWLSSISDIRVVEVLAGPTLSTITGYHGERLLCVTMGNGLAQYYPIVQQESGGYELRDATAYNRGPNHILYTKGQRMALGEIDRIKRYLAGLE